MHLLEKINNVDDLGSKEDYERFYDQYSTIIYGLIVNMFSCEKDKEDVFIKALRAIWFHRQNNLASKDMSIKTIVRLVAKVVFEQKHQFMQHTLFDSVENSSNRFQWAKEVIFNSKVKNNLKDSAKDQIA